MAQKRMLDKKISVNEAVANLPLFGQLLFTWMIPHADDLGLLPFSARTIKALVVPMLDVALEDIGIQLEGMIKEDLIEVVSVDDDKFYHIVKFNDNQTLKKDRKPQTIASNITDWKTVYSKWKPEPSILEQEEKRREVKRTEEKIREDILNNDEKISDEISEVKEKDEEMRLRFAKPSSKSINYSFQAQAMDIIKALNIDDDRKSAYFKVCKEEPRGLVLEAYSFAVDHPKPEAKDKMFFFRLNQLKGGKHAVV